MASAEFGFTVEHTSGSLAQITVVGEIDVRTSPMLRGQALELVDQGRRHLIVDLGPVTFCDSSGLNALIGILRYATGVGGSLVLAAVPERLSRLLALTGVGQIMCTYASADEAMSAHLTDREVPPRCGER